MLYFLIAIFIIALLIFTVVFPYMSINLHITSHKSEIILKFWFYKKKLVLGKEKLSDKPKDKTKTQSKTAKTDKSKSSFDIKERLSDIKKRITDSDKGIDMDEIRSVKNELTEEFSELFTILKKFFSKMRHKINIPLLNIILDFGIGNPASTGISYGAIWSLMGTVYPIVSQYVNLDFPNIDITPDFYTKRFEAEVKSIIKVRPVHIINAAFAAFTKLGLTYFKKISERNVKNNGRQTSNRRNNVYRIARIKRYDRCKHHRR